MGGRAFTIEFTITGLTSKSQDDLLKDVGVRLALGEQLLWPSLPEWACYGDGEHKPVITCTMEPAPEMKLIPSAVCSIKSIDHCSAVVIRTDAEQVLVEILESSGPSTMQPGERRMVDRADVVPDGTYIVLNNPEPDLPAYRAGIRRRKPQPLAGVTLPI